MPLSFVLLFFLFPVTPPTVLLEPLPPLPSQTHAQAIGPTPVYVTRFFLRHLGNPSALTMRPRLYHGLAFTAYPGTAFVVHERFHVDGMEVLRVTTTEVPGENYWLDARHVRFASKPFPERPRKLPARAQVLRALEQAASQGVPYCWGCNYTAGVPRLRTEYGLTEQQLTLYRWDFAGVDCSGLLYEATNGFTPRDTSMLLNHGNPVAIQGKTRTELLSLLQPLDIIVWQGHMLIVLENGQVVESINKKARRFVRKTVKTPLAGRLAEILRTRKPVDEYGNPRHARRKRFVVRRWYPTAGTAPGVTP